MFVGDYDDVFVMLFAVFVCVGAVRFVYADTVWCLLVFGFVDVLGFGGLLMCLAIVGVF